MGILNVIENEINHSKVKVKIVFPEGKNKDIIDVAINLKDSTIEPWLIFKTEKDVLPIVKKEQLKFEVIENSNLEEMANFLFDLRKPKMTLEEAKTLVLEPNYFATIRVKQKQFDGLVGGIEYATKDILKPALQIIKPKPNFKIVSTAMILIKEEQEYLFTDCALNLYPDSNQLGDIAMHSLDFANLLKIAKPQLALLSYSTKGSGIGESVEKMKQVYQLLKDKNIKAIFDGELQFDAAISEEVRKKKAPNSPLKGSANIYLFPNLDAGNIGYKIAQRLGNFKSIGPIVLGLNQPVNDLSRGAKVEDIILTTKVTAFLALKNGV